jgi:starvation-inducible DNA-binding protein
MFDTKNDLPSRTRSAVVELLNARLADAIDLGTQAKQAHWNVKGPNFIALHELFDKIAESVEEHIDLIAERITALGGTAHGTIAAVTRTTTLEPYPEDIIEGADHIPRWRQVPVVPGGSSAREALDFCLLRQNRRAQRWRSTRALDG